MDCSRTSLSRILRESATNPYHSLKGGEYYDQDKLGVSSTGETALHRLLALHTTTPEVLDEYLQTVARIQGDNEVQQQLLHQNCDGATALHVALQRNSWHLAGIVDILLKAAPQLASTPMHCGTFPLHVVTGQSLTINSNVFEILLIAAPEIASKEDVRGDTPLSLLYKNVMRFRWARNWEHGQPPPEEGGDDSSCAMYQKPSSKRDLSSMTIIAPDQYLDYSLQLLEASAACTNTTWQQPKLLSWHTICATDRCPPLLIRMLLHQLYCTGGRKAISETFKERDPFNGKLPLHYAAASKAVSTLFLPSADQHRTVLELVLTAYPAAASFLDRTGSGRRLPLHYAAANATLHKLSSPSPNGTTAAARDPVKAVLALARTYPAALTVRDPFTGLYPVMQLAELSPNYGGGSSDDDVGGGGDDSMDVLYRLLHTNPNVCHYHMQAV